MHIIGISGKIASGKDTVGSIIKSMYPTIYRRIAFADALKQEVADNFGVTTKIIEEMKPIFRPMLQAHGQLRRELDGPEYWLSRALCHIKKLPDNSLVCITDVRHINEALAIRAVGGYLWCIQRNSLAMTDKIEHISETALDAFSPWDNIITNFGTLEDLTTKVKEALEPIMNQ